MLRPLFCQLLVMFCPLGFNFLLHLGTQSDRGFVVRLGLLLGGKRIVDSLFDLGEISLGHIGAECFDQADQPV